MMVTILKSKSPLSIMCNATASDLHRGRERKRHDRSIDHHCVFKLLKCSSQQLCILCFLLYNLTAGSCAEELTTLQTNATTLTRKTPSEPSQEKVQCVGETCYLKIASSKEALNQMVAVSEHLYKATVNGSQKPMDEEQLEKFVKDLGLLNDDHHGHDHGPGIFGNPEYADFYDSLFGDYDDYADEENDTVSRKRRSSDEFPCISSVNELVQTYFQQSPDNISLTLGDFMTLMPQILLDLKRPECTEHEEHDHGHGETPKTNIEHSTRNIWLISFGSVTLISLVSLVGVLVIPLLRHSKILNYVISFLVALAVGTLAGDALLHLLPHASGLHNHDHGAEGHEGHAHGAHGAHGEEGEEEDHFASMWKGLVCCLGIYVFYIIETGMGFVQRWKAGKKHVHIRSCAADSPTFSSPTKEGLKAQDGISPVESPLLSNTKPGSNGSSNEGDGINKSVSLAPLVTVHGGCHHHGGKEKENPFAIAIDEEPLDTGHHHAHSHEVPKTIASLAWMVIIGDGLHNVTDGLAIGAAFASSIGAGLGTVFAVFFHEIPQELGDFAILLNAGMTVKQALLWNFISACTCFIGLIIGLLIGEYTKGIVLWILAFTAGGFLYIALSDMLPAMVKQLNHKDFMKRFILQNVGIVSGFALMVLIALMEESFAHAF